MVVGQETDREWDHLLPVRRPLDTVGVWRAARLHEADQAPVVGSPVEPALADSDKKATCRVSIDNEPLYKSQMRVRRGAKGPAITWIYP